MVRRRLFPLVVLGVLVHGIWACVGGSDDDLNPQPLPPNNEPEKNTDPGGGNTGAVGSSGSAESSSGASGSPHPPPAADAGTNDAGADG